MDMVTMEIGIVGVDEDIVQVNEDVVQVNEDVIQVNEDANIKEVAKNVVHELLKGSWRIGESKRHYTPFKGAIVSLECGFPFVTFADSDKMVGMLEVNVGEHSCFTWTVKEIRDLG